MHIVIMLVQCCVNGTVPYKPKAASQPLLGDVVRRGNGFHPTSTCKQQATLLRKGLCNQISKPLYISSLISPT